MNKNMKSRQQDISLFSIIHFYNLENKRAILKITVLRWQGISHQEILFIDQNDADVLELKSDDPYKNELDVSSFEDSSERD